MSLIVIANNITPDLVRKDGTADYGVEVSINRKTYIWAGEIKGHKRSDGASRLLRLIADAIDKHGEEYALQQEIMLLEALDKTYAVNKPRILRKEPSNA